MPAISNVYTAAGTVFAISADLPATHTIAGFEAISTFTTIAEVVDGGGGGKTSNMTDHSPLGRREVLRVKGSYTQASRDWSLGRDTNDPGQALLLAANDSDNVYSFSMTFQNGDVNYFTALVGSYTDDVGTIDSIVGSSVSTSQQNDTIRLTATGVLTATINSAGLTYDADGDFTATQASTTGAGVGAEFAITIAAGIVTAVAVSKTGTGYIVGETITIAVVGSTPGTAATFDVATIVTAL